LNNTDGVITEVARRGDTCPPER